MKVIPGELSSITNLIVGFLQDLTPDPDGLEEVTMDTQVLSGLMVLASSLVPKNDNEAVELTYIKDALRGMKEET